MYSKVFALGSNSSGQLGIGHEDDASVPQPCVFDPKSLEVLPEDDRIVQIVGGGSHTLLRFNSGAVYAAGNNEHGQCNLYLTPHVSTFTRVVQSLGTYDSGFNNFSDIAATWATSFLVKHDGRIHIFGSGSKGEYGLGEGITRKSCFHLRIPEIVDRKLKIVDISGGMNHVALLTSEGAALGWGASRKGQLGQDVVEMKIAWTPTQVTLPFRATRVATGRDFTVFSDSMGSSLLLGETKHFKMPSTLGEFNQLSAGWSNVYALSYGRVEAIGRNDRGQLPSEELPDLKMIAAGSEHCLGLTTAGEAVAWGWGEHGNCGEPVDAAGNVADRWNRLPVELGDDEVISLVAAGCATSFIVVDRKR